jgi:hypothetical protein
MSSEIQLHMSRSSELLIVARENLVNHHPADAISRAYYAMFHAATAVLLKLGIERSSHKGVISAFGESVVKAGMLDIRYHEYIRAAFESRNESDYLPCPEETPEDARITLEQAGDFVAVCKKILAS